MSLLIEGMKMPSKCYECFLQNECNLVNPYYIESTRPQDCPIIEVHKPCNNCQEFDCYGCKWKEGKK